MTERSLTVELDADLTLHCRTAGPEDGTPLLLLHGFPDFSHGWRRQIPFFAARGFRVIAPDLPGYAQSSKPRGLARYRLPSLATDMTRLLDRLGVQKCHVVGHDWGAGLTWQLAATFPERFETAAVICVPHLAVLSDHIRRNKHSQMLRSSYMAFFQLPLLPESLFKIQGGQWLARGLAKSSRPGTFTEADQQAYAEAWAVPRAPTAMLSWYRANIKTLMRPPTTRIKTPMLVIWGDKDSALNHHMADDSLAYCDGPARVLHVAKGTHWVHVELADEVNEALAAHIAGKA